MRKLALTTLAAIALVSSSPAQNTFMDTVTVTAPDPNASERGLDPGLFEIRRSGPTNFPLRVFYRVGGSASNGVDYQTISGGVVIPEGSLSALIPVKPIADTLIEGPETVVLQIFPSPLMCPAPMCGYFIGWPSNATVTIADDITVLAGVNIYATDPDATEQSPLVDAAPDTATFTVQRSDTNESIVVYYEISGTASNGVDYEKLSGQVTIPAGGWSADIVVTPIDDNLVEGTETVELTLIAPCPPCLFANPPCDVPQGSNCYPIGPQNKAVAYIHDNDRPPATNRPVVTIVATDPIAVEGDFCGSNWWWTTAASDGGWTTNSRPPSPCPRTNTATFEVRRSGGTNSDLTVYYRIGGTASNGIDYVTLPNNVIIPAGRYAARIEIVPIDDTIPERIETVVLSLTAPTSPLGYQIGYPRQAAAIILDNDQPRPHCGRLSDGLFHLCAPGTNGFVYCIRTSTDLVTWTSLCSNVVTDGAIHFVDPDAADIQHRFYQVVPETSNSPPQ